MTFKIRIKYSGRWYQFVVEQFDVDERNEKFRIIARNKIVVLQSNRPFFRSKGIKHRKPDWKVIEGEISNSSGLEDIQKAILEVVDK
ncbi:MAG TPA: hypothetical protein VK718_09255 [Ferruginibacter sp.]|jgi:hypothetical protein|nr:hypothetical protein [Ferruginibacter sp.]